MITFLRLTLILVPFCVSSLFGDILITQDRKGKPVIVKRKKSAVKRKGTVSYMHKAAPKRTRGGYRTTVPGWLKSKIRSMSEKYGVDEKLIVAVIRAESGFRSDAVSHKGAVGLMQLMPDTARYYKVRNRYDVDENLKGGISFLKHLLKKYIHLPLVLAAYNAGEKAVIKYGGVPPYKETRNYVRKVMRFMGKGYRGASFSRSRRRSGICKYTTAGGKVIISDRRPRGYKIVKVETI